MALSTLAPDAKFQGFQSTNEQISRIRIHRSAKTNHDFPDLGDFFPAAGDRTGDNIRMPGQIFGGAVHHQIETHCERLLQNGSGKRVVDDRNEFMLSG